MIVYYRNQRVVLVNEDEHFRTIRMGGGEEVKLPRNEVLDNPPQSNVQNDGGSPAPAYESYGNKHSLPRVSLDKIRQGSDEVEE